MGLQRHGLRPFRPTNRVCVRQRHGDPLHRPERRRCHQSFCPLVLPSNRGQRFKHGLRCWLFTDAHGRLFPDWLHSRRRQGRHQQRQQHGLRLALPNSQRFGGQHHGARLHDGCRVAEKVLNQINEKLSGRVVTKISKIYNYCKAEEYHQKYLEKN